MSFVLRPRALLGVVRAASISCGDRRDSGSSVSNPCVSPSAPQTRKNTSRRNPPKPFSSRSSDRFETPAREDSSAWVMFLPRRICARRHPASRNASKSVIRTSNFIILHIWRIATPFKCYLAKSGKLYHNILRLAMEDLQYFANFTLSVTWAVGSGKFM